MSAVFNVILEFWNSPLIRGNNFGRMDNDTAVPLIVPGTENWHCWTTSWGFGKNETWMRWKVTWPLIASETMELILSKICFWLMSLFEDKTKMKISAAQTIKQAVIQRDIFLNRVIDNRRLWMAGFSMGSDLYCWIFFPDILTVFFFDCASVLSDK